jgi:hypothetical protein
MAATVEDICNSALIKCGSKTITSISEANKRAELCTIMYPKVRDKVLKSHPWNFAIKRAALDYNKATFLDAAVNTGTDRITITGHGQTTGQKVVFSATVALPSPLVADTVYYIIYIDANTIQLALTAADALLSTAIDLTSAAAGGTHTARWVPLFDWSYSYVLPTDYLRTLRAEYHDIAYAIEGDYLLCNDSSFVLKYISKITDVTKFPEDFDELLSWWLAYELAYPLVQSNTLKETLKAEIEEYLRDVRSFDAQEGTPEDFLFDEWINVRY